MGVTIAAFAAGPQTSPQDPPFGRVLIRRGPQPRGESQLQPQGPLLLFNLVVLDSKGDPFPGLRAADVDIRDDGQPMQAVFCRSLETPDRQSAPLGPNQYSNRPTSGNSPSTLVLLDLLNENFAERGLGWNDVLSAIQKVEFSGRVYVYMLTQEGAVYPVRPLPDAEHPDSPDDDGWVAQLQTLLDEAMHAGNPTQRRELQSDVDARVQTTLGAVRDLASDFASQPGRKCLVWISRGVPIGARGADLHWHDFTLSVMRLGTDLARSGIAVYAVDQQTDHPTPSLTGMDTLDQLARLTAGQWFPSGATAEAIRQAMSEGPATYQVAYRPPVDRWNNKFHQLQVTAEGQGGAGLRVRTIDGYYGYEREADPRDSFAPAAVGPSDVSAIGIRATAAPSQRGQGWIHFEICVDAADLRLTRGASYTGRFLLAFAYYSTGWQLDLTEEVPTDLQLTSQEYDAVMRGGVRLSLDRPVRAGASKMRIVVRDPESGAVGSLTVPVGAGFR